MQILKRDNFLPTGNLSLNEAVERGFDKMLYAVRQDDAVKYPEWQFIDEAEEPLLEIICIFAERNNEHLHLFLVTAMDTLNELSPAEVLTGKYWDTRTGTHAPHHSQERIINLPADERLRRVVEAAKEYTDIPW